MKKVITQYGIILHTMKEVLLIGETFICSMVPASFSPTMFSAGKKPVTIVTAITMSAGTMKTL